MKKIACVVLTLSIAFMLYVPTYAISYVDGRLITEADRFASGTISDIKELVSERNHAILSGDMEEADNILNEIYSLGARPSTPTEIASTTNSNNASTLRSGDFDFITTEYKAYANSEYYDVREIIVAVGMDCNLYHSYDFIQTSSSDPVEAGVAALFSVAASTGVGMMYPEVSTFETIFEVLCDVIDDLKTTTIVDDVAATYSVSIIEQCSFLSYFNEVNNVWNNYASTQYIDYAVTAVVRGINYTGTGRTTIDNEICSYEGTIHAGPKEMYNAGAQLARYFRTYLHYHDCEVRGFYLKDCTGTIINTRGLVCPHNTSEVY